MNELLTTIDTMDALKSVPLFVNVYNVDSEYKEDNISTWRVTEEQYTLKDQIDILLKSGWIIYRQLDNVLTLAHGRYKTKQFVWRYANDHEMPGSHSS